ncbi:MAG TPA: polyketide synthase [Kiritimatiellia bacterium]|nr:polyketide synthase [Kiritimatiellia bacterium]
MKALQDDVAIIGMAGLFPGAPDVSAFWENILAARCCISEHPAPEAKRVLDPAPKEFSRVYTIRGGFLGPLATFDPLAYGVMPDSVTGGDPDHFLALRVAAEALADSGLKDEEIPRERTDVIVGHGTYINPGNVNWVQHGVVLDQTMDLLRQWSPGLPEAEYARLREALRAGLPPLAPQTLPSLIPNILAGRIANRLDLMGANYIIDAACASSLLAVDQSIKNLLLDRADLALVGGVQACVPLPALMVFTQLKALTRGEAPRPFSADADGTLLGEGVGFVVLKRLRDAQRDGNRIYAVIRGTGVASDGRAQGLLAPRLDGETLAIRRAYEAAQVEPRSVELIEAHGTGIALGDATEIRALRAIFGGRNGSGATCAVGSVKSMIGHCIPAAGMASLIKSTLALHHRILPPTLGCETPHPDLGLADTPFYLNTETRPWIHSGATPRRAGVSSMGFGGINTHCVLEEAPA